jgi:hypothetical protein
MKKLNRPADMLVSSAYAGALLSIAKIGPLCASSPAIPRVLIRLFWHRLLVLGM